MATDRAEVLAYAREHGDVAAAERFGVRRGTIRQWRKRERERARRPAPPRATVAPARVSTVVEGSAPRHEPGSIRRLLGETSSISRPVEETIPDLPPPPPGPSAIDHGLGVSSRTIPGQRERVFTATVMLWPLADWLDGLRVSGDLGLGVCLACGQRDGACWCD
jgi:transposase-like protein